MKAPVEFQGNGLCCECGGFVEIAMTDIEDYNKCLDCERAIVEKEEVWVTRYDDYQFTSN